MRALYIVTTLLLVLGCGALNGANSTKLVAETAFDDDPDEEADVDADTDADTDTDTETETDTDTGSAGANACGRYAAIEEGRAWTWSYADSGTTGTMVSTVTRFDGEEGLLRMVFDLSYGGTYTMSQTTDTAFTCDDGFVSVSSSGSYSGTSSGTPFSGTWETTYTAAGPGLPLTLAEGQTWTARFAGETRSNPGGTSSFDYTVDYEALGEESVTVPAGTYDAWRLELTTRASGSTTTSTSWVAADVGGVKTSSTELTAFTP